MDGDGRLQTLEVKRRAGSMGHQTTVATDLIFDYSPLSTGGCFVPTKGVQLDQPAAFGQRSIESDGGLEVLCL